MFKLNEKNEVNRIILLCDYNRYSPSDISTINTGNSQIYIKKPREDSAVSLLKSHLDLNFDVLHAVTNIRYADKDDIGLVNLGVIGLFSSYKLTTISGKPLKDISHAHIVSLMYKLITSARDTDDLSVGFDRDRGRRQRELCDNKTQKGKFYLKIMIKDKFGFAKHQEKATSGLGFKLTLTRSVNSSVLKKDNAINNAKIKIIAIEMYVPHLTPSISKQAIIFRQIASRTPTGLQYVERSVFMKEVVTFWTFESRTQEGNNVPIWIIVGFQQRDRQDSQILSNDTFYRPPVTSTQCPIRTEKYPDSAILLYYSDDDYSQGFGQYKEVFRALPKDKMLQPYVSEHDFRSSNNVNDIDHS